MLPQEVRKLVQCFLPAAGRDKEHRLLAALHVDEHRYVVMAALAGRIIKANTVDSAQVELSNGLFHVVLDNAPQPLVGDLH